jgi:hypothetical protein
MWMWRHLDVLLTDFSEEHIASIFYTSAHARGFILPWRLRRYVLPKRRLTKYLYGATSQKTEFFECCIFKTDIVVIIRKFGAMNGGRFLLRTIGNGSVDNSYCTFVLLSETRHIWLLMRQQVSSFHWLYSPPWALASDFQIRVHFAGGRTPWTRDQPITRPLPKHRTTQT